MVKILIEKDPIGPAAPGLHAYRLGRPSVRLSTAGGRRRYRLSREPVETLRWVECYVGGVGLSSGDSDLKPLTLIGMPTLHKRGPVRCGPESRDIR